MPILESWPEWYPGAVAAWCLVAAVSFCALLFVPAPYGRHARPGWGPMIPDRLAWLVMESPASLVVAAWFVGRPGSYATALWIFFALWQLHYVNRAFVYPLASRSRRARTPLAIAAMAFVFNLINGSLIGLEVFHWRDYGSEWLTDPRFVVGLVLFLSGLLVNRQSDRALDAMRKGSGDGYRVPDRGLHRFVANPNYLGEIVEWIGFAVMTWSFAGAAFALWTIANLAPRARTNLTWSRERIPGYPVDRKALIPYVW